MVYAKIGRKNIILLTLTISALAPVAAKKQRFPKSLNSWEIQSSALMTMSTVKIVANVFATKGRLLTTTSPQHCTKWTITQYTTLYRL